MSIRSSVVGCVLAVGMTGIVSFLAGQVSGMQRAERPLAPQLANRVVLTLHTGFPNDPNYSDVRIEFDPTDPPDLSQLRHIREAAREAMR